MDILLRLFESLQNEGLNAFHADLALCRHIRGAPAQTIPPILIS